MQNRKGLVLKRKESVIKDVFQVWGIKIWRTIKRQTAKDDATIGRIVRQTANNYRTFGGLAFFGILAFSQFPDDFHRTQRRKETKDHVDANAYLGGLRVLASLRLKFMPS